MNTVCRCVVIVMLFLAALPALAAIDRHPELQSRPIAWSAYDGSYLVNTFSRAEMVDFYWNVLNADYPATDWTGTFTPQNAGTFSEARRVREIAQLNAYRALNYSAPATEDATFSSQCQDAAFVMGLNVDKWGTMVNGHQIDPSWPGYTTEVDATLRASLIDNYIDPALTPSISDRLSGAVDTFIFDAGNAQQVGHRDSLLHDSNTVIGIGEARTNQVGSTGIAVLHSPWTWVTTPNARFVAYPAPGFMPYQLLGGGPNYASARWSFRAANDGMTFLTASEMDVNLGKPLWTVAAGLDRRDATITATINGVPVPLRDPVINSDLITWDFDPQYLPLGSTFGMADVVITVTINNVGEVGSLDGGAWTVIAYHDYTYTVTLFDPATITKDVAHPVTPLVNISTRSTIGTGEGQLIAGLSVGGTVPVRVALRAQGPGLAAFGITNPAKSTHIRLYNSSNQLIGENAGWRNHPDWRLLQARDVNPQFDSEAGMVLTLWPGTYTAVVSDDTGSNGIGIVEAFNIDDLTADSQLVNLSTRGNVGINDRQMIGGFIIQSRRTVVIRTQGPTLAKFGVANTVADTVLSVVSQSSGQVIATNDDWQTDSRNDRLKTDLAADAPGDPHEAALVLTLDPGAYTALVSAKGPTGVGIVEVFDVGSP